MGLGHLHSVELLSFICIQALVHGSMNDALASIFLTWYFGMHM